MKRYRLPLRVRPEAMLALEKLRGKKTKSRYIEDELMAKARSLKISLDLTKEALDSIKPGLGEPTGVPTNFVLAELKRVVAQGRELNESVYVEIAGRTNKRYKRTRGFLRDDEDSLEFVKRIRKRYMKRGQVVRLADDTDLWRDADSIVKPSISELDRNLISRTKNRGKRKRTNKGLLQA